MPTNRRRRQRARVPEIMEWERQWAQGERLSDADRGRVYFLTETRAQSVLEAVHGVPFAQWLRGSGLATLGCVVYGHAIIATLSEGDVVVLEAGGDPWGLRSAFPNMRKIEP